MKKETELPNDLSLHHVTGWDQRKQSFKHL